ncbi:MAG: DUF1292 domain-containing protein [Eubacterium sp.]|nr:DUF1292 domain-containing protein [Eubacterium sp.]
MEKDFLREEDADDVRITLELDDGSSLECKPLTIFEAGGRDYIAILPLDEDDKNEDGEVFIYRYSEDEDGEGVLDNIEDDEEYEIVSDRFDEILDEMMFDDMED